MLTLMPIAGFVFSLRLLSNVLASFRLFLLSLLWPSSFGPFGFIFPLSTRRAKKIFQRTFILDHKDAAGGGANVGILSGAKVRNDCRFRRILQNRRAPESPHSYYAESTCTTKTEIVFQCDFLFWKRSGRSRFGAPYPPKVDA